MIKNILNNNSTSSRKNIVLSKIEKTFIVYHLDLSPVEECLKSLYSPDPRGRKPRDPVCMLRSIIIMILEGETSITKWAETLRTDNFLSELSGWVSEKPPSVGTFYKFLDRLQDGPYRKSCDHVHKASDLDKGRHEKNFKKSEKGKPEKDYSGDDSVTEKLMKTLIPDTENPRQNDFLKRLEDILMNLAVKHSVKKGLVDPLNLEICGDGSPIRSGANKQGKPSCKCLKEKNLRTCDCPRLYTDPDSDWGYDSYRKVYYYGETFYLLCYCSKGHNLPLHILCGPASETDFTFSMKAFHRFLKTLRENNIEYKISAAIFDAGHDAMGIYKYFRHLDIPVVIPLNNRGAKNTYKNRVKLSDRGIPLCNGGKEMRHLGYNKKRMRHQFGCPVKRMTHRDGKAVYVTHHEECPMDCRCSPNTTHGPIVSIFSKENPRLFPEIPRNLPKFKELYNLRGGNERSNSAKKHAYQIEKAGLKSRAKRLIMLHLLAVIDHWKAIFKEETEGLTREEILQNLLADEERASK